MRRRAQWTKEQEQILLDNYGKIYTDELANKIGKTKGQIINKASYLRELGYDLPPSIREVPGRTKRDIEFIKNNMDMKQVDIAKKLNRSVSFVNKRYNEILKKTKVPKLREKEKAKKREKERIMRERHYAELNRKIHAGVYKKDIKVDMGKAYEIIRMQNRLSKDEWRKFTGKVIHETKDHFTLKSKHRTETMLKVDFLIGILRMKKIS